MATEAKGKQKGIVITEGKQKGIVMATEGKGKQKDIVLATESKGKQKGIVIETEGEGKQKGIVIATKGEGKKKGRKKVEMKKIEKESNLLVTFSKRRAGLFKKASELSTLCGAEVAIVAFSPGGKKAYTFGHPCADTVIDRYLSENHPSENSAPAIGTSTSDPIEFYRNARIHGLNMELTQVLEKLEGEKKKGQMLDKALKADQKKYWFQKPIEDLNIEQLEQLKIGMEELKIDVVKEANENAVKASNAAAGVNPVGGGGGVVPLNNNNPTGFNPAHAAQDFGHRPGSF